MPEICDLGQGQYGVPVGVCGHVVDEIDNTIFQTTGVKPVHHMKHQRPIVAIHANSRRIVQRLEAPERIPGSLNDLGIEGRFDVNERSPLDQLFP
jgi:hypothetical protein